MNDICVVLNTTSWVGKNDER